MPASVQPVRLATPRFPSIPLQLLLLLDLLLSSGGVISGAAPDLSSFCIIDQVTPEPFFYDYDILDQGCSISCFYLTSSPGRADYFDSLLISNHSLEETEDCQKNRYPATGYLCYTIVAAKIRTRVIASHFPFIRFMVRVGQQSVTSEPLLRSPVTSDGMVSYNAVMCLPEMVGIDDKINVIATGAGRSGVTQELVELMSLSDGVTARTVLRDGMNGTKFGHGEESEDPFYSIVTFTP